MNPHFASLVMGIAAQAQAALDGHLPPEAPITDARLIAQTLIDTLGMLQEKTRGRLDDEERRLLDQVLADLRIRFVSGGGPAGSAQH
jgi:hypothetical protein